VSQYAPDLVGLSVMTFQRATALQVARLVKMIRPSARIVVGGYDPSLAADAYEPSLDIDFVVRGEGEQTLAELLRALEATTPDSAIRNPQSRGPQAGVPSAAPALGWESGTRPGWESAIRNVLGLSHRDGMRFVHNPARPVMPLATEKLRLPKRGARVLEGYTLLGRQIDVVETSRGCTFDCSFCSIIEMRGRNFHPFPIDRVIADIADAHGRGARSIFLVDDNITLDVRRFEALCHALIDADFDDMEYFVQAMTAPLAQHGATLAPLMRRAGFRYVFLGIENVLDDDLTFLRARAKNARREQGRTVGNASIEAIGHLHRNGMYVVGGLIVGNPDDTREAIEANLEFARRYVDWPYIQHPTPYPRTPMTSEFRSRGLIVDEDVTHYDGTTAVVRTASVSADDAEFMRWQAERWMKLRHFPRACVRSPGFVARHGLQMLAHTFAGSSWRYFLGMQDEREVFRRFRDQRRRERASCLPFGLEAARTVPSGQAA
jgi:radical SAM superfamily enzyme YgiQ (UPF0313 family)